MSALLFDDGPRERGSEAEPTPPLTPERAKALLSVAFRPTVFALVAIVTAVVVTLVVADSELTGLAGAIAAGWLALHQVPLTIGSASLGVLPLLPTIGLIWLVARNTHRAVSESSPDREIGVLASVAVAGPLIITIVCLAVVKDASGVVALVPPNTLASFAWVVAVHLFGTALGIGWRLRVRIRQLLNLPAWVDTAASAAVRASTRLALAAVLVTLVSAAAHWSTLSASLDTADGLVGGFGLTLLSLLYLPNVAIGAAAVVTGSAFHVGAGSVGLFAVVVGGPVPGLPVLAAVPPGPAAPWWPALMIVPAAVGIALGRDCARAGLDRISAAQAAAVAAGIVGVVAAVLGLVGGGNLGVFGRIGVMPLLSGLLTFAWLALLGATAAVLFAARAEAAVEPAKPVDTDIVDDVETAAAVEVEPIDGDDADHEIDEADLPEESRNGDG